MRSAITCLLVCSAGLASGPADVAYTISTVAGGTFAGDGRPAAAAYLGSPEGLAVDTLGNLYIADSQDHRIRKIDSSGVITTVAGNGYRGFRGDGGPADAAQLDTPYGLAFDAAGNLYIADLGNARVRRITPDGMVETVAGGPDSPFTFKQPRNVTVDRGGNLYISDFGDHRVYRVTPQGAVECIAGLGWPGSIPDDEEVRADLAPLRAPAGLTFDASGALYIADSGNGRVRKVQDGTMSTVETGGFPLGVPAGVAFDAAGDLYVADKTSAVIIKLTPSPARAIAGDGTSGNSGDGGPAVSARLTEPRDLVFDGAGNLYIADSRPGDRYPAGTVRRVSSSGLIETYAGGTDFRPRGDSGPALWAHLEAPSGIAAAKDGTLYIADRGDQRVRKVSGGAITTVAAGLDQPGGIALDDKGNVWIAEAGGSRVWQLDHAGGITLAAGLAGADSAGYTGDGDAATDGRLNAPAAAAVAGGGVYIADTLNHAIRQILPGGIIVTIAGTGEPGHSGDGGPATSALLNAPAGVAVDAAGNIYIADTGNHSVRKIDALGMMSTAAGTGDAGFGGDGGPAAAAQLRAPTRVALDAAGNLYIADTGNHRVRRVARDGLITTIAGTGAPGYSGDGGPALAAELNEPADIFVDPEGNIFIADRANNRVRKLAVYTGPVEPPAGQPNIVNAASLLPGSVAPGEVASIFGTALGPGTAATGRLSEAGLLETRIADMEVLFDGTPAPLLYVQYSRINLQVPYEVAGRKSAIVEIRQGGVTKTRLVTAVAESAPAVFTVDGGGGPASAINEDGTANSAANPAAPGSIVTLYATGEGQTSPAGITGRLAAAPYPAPLLPVSVTAGGRAAGILFAGSAPGYAGLVQINFRIPASLGAGAAPVEVKAGSGKSQPGVTIAVR